MVLLTIFTTSNPHTLYFDHPIEKPNYIKLLSMSLYNSWYNLKQNAAIVYNNLSNNKTLTKSFIPGHYTIKQLAKAIQGAFPPDTVVLTTELNTIRGGMTISNPHREEITVSSNLAKLMGIDPDINGGGMIDVKRLTSPSTYFVHCDLIDKKQTFSMENLQQSWHDSIFVAKPLKRVHYQTPQPHVLRDTDSGDYAVNSITLSVQDKNGNLFNFEGMPLEFEVEIN